MSIVVSPSGRRNDTPSAAIRRTTQAMPPAVNRNQGPKSRTASNLLAHQDGYKDRYRSDIRQISRWLAASLTEY
jgi:hypothetical protein